MYDIRVKALGNIKRYYNQIREIWSLIDKNPKRKFILFSVLSASVNVLDIIGIFLFASFASGTLNVLQGRNQSTRLELAVKNLLNIEIDQARFLSYIATAMLISFLTKSLCGALLNRKMLFFLAEIETLAANRVFRNFMQQKADRFFENSAESFHYASGTSTARIFSGVLYPLSLLLTDGILLAMILTVLIVASPLTTIMSIFILGISIFLIGKRSRLGIQLASASLVNHSIRTQELSRESFESYREANGVELLDYFERKFIRERGAISHDQARILWLQLVPRFSLELLVILSASIIAAIELILNDTRTALIKLSVFIVTSFRILPAVQRMQTSSLGVNSGLVASRMSVHQLTLPNDELITNNAKFSRIGRSIRTQIKEIAFQNASYAYPQSKDFLFRGISNTIPGGKIVGITGPSGIGKSTFLDCISGLRTLTEGEIHFYAKDRELVSPKISYVPQKPLIMNATLMENITLSEETNTNELNRFRELFDLFFQEEIKPTSYVYLNQSSVITKGFNSISGGQAQRIAIMRGLYKNPDLLMMDECLSGLDQEKVYNIFEILRNKYANLSVLIVSHSSSILNLCDETYLLTRTELTRRQ